MQPDSLGEHFFKALAGMLKTKPDFVGGNQVPAGTPKTKPDFLGEAKARRHAEDEATLFRRKGNLRPCRKRNLTAGRKTRSCGHAPDETALLFGQHP